MVSTTAATTNNNSNHKARKLSGACVTARGPGRLYGARPSSPFTTTNQLGRVESAATAAQLGALLNDKDKSLRNFARQACSLENTNDRLMGMAKSIVSGLTKQNDEQIMRLYFSSHNDGSTMLHSVDGQTDPNEVAPKSSTKDYVPIDPKSSSRKKFQVPNHIVTDTFDVRRTGW